VEFTKFSSVVWIPFLRSSRSSLVCNYV